VFGVEDQVDWFAVNVIPHLTAASRTIFEGSVDEGDPDMALDHGLQFSLIEGIRIPDGRLESVEETVRYAYDPALVTRSLGWIAKHRERNRAAA